MSIEQNLIAIRDAAHLNQGALGAVRTQAGLQYDQVRTEWSDSPTKRSILAQLATVMSSYGVTQREAIELRDAAIGALTALTDDPPPLPDSSSSSVTWSVEEW